jgi:hypothetical protein
MWAATLICFIIMTASLITKKKTPSTVTLPLLYNCHHEVQCKAEYLGCLAFAQLFHISVIHGGGVGGDDVFL